MDKRYFTIAAFLLISFFILTSFKIPDSPGISSESQDCISCHETVTPGIVSDWRTSRHSHTSFSDALAKPDQEKRVSSENVPANLQNVVVGCYECHGLNSENHKDNFAHFGYNINIVVSPNDCAVCHKTEVAQYSHSKKAHALENLRDNPVFTALVNTSIGVQEYHENSIKPMEPSHFTQNETCYACHGTDLKVEGTKTISTDLGDVEVPVLKDWPNQGVGRINPDGSTGSCTPCHPRHSFSIEIARDPHTCGQCHLAPDVPAYNIYKESKHGNIFEASEQKWNFENVPWTLGKDFTAPTCAACHNALVVSPSGDVIAERSHDFGARLWVRVFGLIYAHPQPKSGKTFEIRNRDGLPLPVTFDGVPADSFLISKDEQTARQHKMMNICSSCHGDTWVTNWFEKMDNTLKETDQMTAAATNMLSQAWKEKLADNTNPFDENIEQMWVQQWLFYANSVRYSSAMSGPDYAAFKNGWWYLTRNLNDMRAMMMLLRSQAK